MDERLGLGELLGMWSIFLGYQNLQENREQSAHNDVSAANEKQAAYMLAEISRKFDEQNELLNRILEAVEI